MSRVLCAMVEDLFTLSLELLAKEDLDEVDVQLKIKDTFRKLTELAKV